MNVLNLFNQNTVLGRYEGIEQDELGPGDFGLTGTANDQSGRIAFDKAFFNGGITVANIQALICKDPTGTTCTGAAPHAADARYNQPILFQSGRQIRLGFRFMF